MTLGAYAAGPWREQCFQHYKPSTRKRTESCLRVDLRPAFGHLELDAIHLRHVERWYAAKSASAPTQANRSLDILRQMIRHAEAMGYRAEGLGDPCQVIRVPAVHRTRYLSSAELEEMHSMIDQSVAKWIPGQGDTPGAADAIRLLLATGCRKMEILGLAWSEVRSDRVRLTDSKTGGRIVPLSGAALAILERRRAARNGSPWVFPSPRDGSKHRDDVRTLWLRVRPPGVRLHDLRHTFASHAVMNGVSLPVLAMLLGHASPQMTMRYAHVGDRETAAAAARTGERIAALMAAGVVAPGR